MEITSKPYLSLLSIFSKINNVSGISGIGSKKAMDMYLKCRYLDEINDGRGIVFATGTPISNSMTELYTNMRYLQYGTLQRLGLGHFDTWASTFGETTTALELAPEGTGYRARTRFAKFFNLPELMNIFKEAALSYAEIKALCAGDPRIKERMELDTDVARLKIIRADHQNLQYRLEDSVLVRFPAQIAETEKTIEAIEADMETLARHPHPVDSFAGNDYQRSCLWQQNRGGDRPAGCLRGHCG